MKSLKKIQQAFEIKARSNRKEEKQQKEMEEVIKKI
jgi:hypothetical protein